MELNIENANNADYDDEDDDEEEYDGLALVLIQTLLLKINFINHIEISYERFTCNHHHRYCLQVFLIEDIT